MNRRVHYHRHRTNNDNSSKSSALSSPTAKVIIGLKDTIASIGLFRYINSKQLAQQDILPDEYTDLICINTTTMDSEDESLDLLTFGKELVRQLTLKSAGIASIDFDRLLDPPLQLHEDLSEGCGGQLWPAGMVLAKYMLRMHKETVKGKTMFVRSTYPRR